MSLSDSHLLPDPVGDLAGAIASLSTAANESDEDALHPELLLDDIASAGFAQVSKLHRLRTTSNTSSVASSGNSSLSCAGSVDAEHRAIGRDDWPVVIMGHPDAADQLAHIVDAQDKEPPKELFLKEMGAVPSTWTVNSWTNLFQLRADLHYKYDKPQSFAIIPSFPSLEAIYGFLHLEATEIKIKHFPNPSVRPLWPFPTKLKEAVATASGSVDVQYEILLLDPKRFSPCAFSISPLNNRLAVHSYQAMPDHRFLRLPDHLEPFPSFHCATSRKEQDQPNPILFLLNATSKILNIRDEHPLLLQGLHEDVSSRIKLILDIFVLLKQRRVTEEEVVIREGPAARSMGGPNDTDDGTDGIDGTDKSDGTDMSERSFSEAGEQRGDGRRSSEPAKGEASRKGEKSRDSSSTGAPYSLSLDERLDPSSATFIEDRKLLNGLFGDIIDHSDDDDDGEEGEQGYQSLSAAEWEDLMEA